jgi:adenylate kinase family enzyme
MATDTQLGRRIIVLGTTGSGKTTVAARLARHLGVPHVELDALIHGPNWVDVPPAVFRARTAQATAGDGWVVDGNYGEVRDLVWPRVQTAIWLDYPMHVPLRRVTWRTLRRIILRETIYNDNRETLRYAIFNREGLITWIITTHRTRRREFTARFQQPESAHLIVYRFRSPRETAAWLDGISPQRHRGTEAG